MFIIYVSMFNPQKTSHNTPHNVINNKKPSVITEFFIVYGKESIKFLVNIIITFFYDIENDTFVIDIIYQFVLFDK